jgi:hypothetical protein
VPLDSTAGQLILRFVDENGAPVSGVRITFSPFGGQNAFRMYDSGPGGSYIVDANSAGQTSTLGTVIIGNVTDGIGALSYRFNDVEYKTPDIMWVKPQATYARIRITGS